MKRLPHRSLTTRLVPALLVALLAPAVHASDATLEEILAGYWEALGGKEAWSQVESMRQTGTMTISGMEAPFTLVAAQPNKMRMEFELQGMKGIQAYDGENGWMVMPFMTGSEDPEPLPEDTEKELAASGGVAGPLYEWEEKGHRVELVGKTQVEGTDVHELEITLASGKVMHWFLDAEYHVPIQTRMEVTVQGQTFETTTTLSDYKEVDGLMIPHSNTQVMPMGQQSMTVESVEINPDLPADIFAMPETSDEEEGTDEGSD